MLFINRTCARKYESREGYVCCYDCYLANRLDLTVLFLAFIYLLVYYFSGRDI